METILQQIRPWLELLYFLSGVFLACVALYGLRQVKLMKYDIQLRTERAAKEKALEYSGRYLSTEVSLDDRFIDDCTKAKLPSSYPGPIGDFTAASVPREFVKAASRRVEIDSWRLALNELETIAAAFVNGIADEQLGFSIIGRSFCASVAQKYDVISGCRSDKAQPYFENVVTLYHIWAPRLSKSELAARRLELDSQISAIPDKHVPALGSE